MKIHETKLKDLLIVEPKIFGDNRGWFMESYNDAIKDKLGGNINFIQDNHSYSSEKGTLRGLHFQNSPMAQTKLIRCTRGEIFDVAVDLRRNSPTYKEWFGIYLSAENKKQLLIPKGFAHGFLTTVDDVEVQYKVDVPYSPIDDRSVLWSDKDINIDWPLTTNPILSDKDKNAPILIDSDCDFEVHK